MPAALQSRLPDQDGRARYRYQSPGYSAEITVDEHGFTLEYGGFLRRLAT
ncbi:putative glycolipid-binding domain-containing protein [Chromobacterium sphagni]